MLSHKHDNQWKDNTFTPVNDILDQGDPATAT